jgi:hypothetical protein
MLGLHIKLPGYDEGIFGIKALLANPEGMFKTNKDGCPWSGKEHKYKRKGRINQTNKRMKRRCLCNWKYKSEENQKGGI